MVGLSEYILDYKKTDCDIHVTVLYIRKLLSERGGN